MPRTKKEKRELSDNRILSAAIECFAASGFTGTKLGEIAEKAEVSQGLLSQRGITKDSLYMDIVKRQSEQTLGFFSESRTFSENMFQFLDLMSDKKDTVSFNFASRFFKDADTPAPAMALFTHELEASVICRQAAAEMENGTLKKEEPVRCVLRFFRLVVGIMDCYLKSETPLPSKEYFRHFLGLKEASGGLGVIDLTVFSLLDDFACIAIIDFDTKTTWSIRVSPLFAKYIDNWEEIHDFEIKNQLFADRMVVKEDQSRFLLEGNMDELRKNTENGNVYFIDYHVRLNGRTEAYQSKVVRSESNPSQAILGIHSIEVEKQIEQKNEQSMATIAKLAGGFEAVSYVSFDKDADGHNSVAFQTSDLFRSLVPGWEEEQNFAKQMQLIKKYLVSTKDRDRFSRMTRMDVIRDELRKNENYHVTVRVTIKEENFYYMLKFSRDTISAKSNGFILGIRNADADTKSAIERQNEIELEVRNRTVDLNEKNKALRRINDEFVEMVGDVVEVRNEENEAHTKRVKGLTFVLAEQVRESLPEYNLTAKDVSQIASAAALHDIGKIMIPDSILFKPGKLTPEEFEIVKMHCERGSGVLNRAPKDWSDAYLKVVKDICACHHERWDGSGYPKGLKGDDIPISAQIVSVADCFDALISKRSYNDTFTPDQAFEMIRKGECGSFSEKLMRCFDLCRERFLNLANDFSVEIAQYSPLAHSDTLLQNSRILLVEDNLLNRELENDVLTEAGAVVTEAENGIDAVKLFLDSGENAFDLILMDLTMPIMDGVEATRKIRGLKSDYATTIPILALTANTSNEILFDAIDAGADSYVNKPLVLSQLTAKLFSSIQSRSRKIAKRLVNTMERANTDPLTGVKNITAYTEAIASLTTRLHDDEPPKFALVECDINGLKLMNDTNGHDAGDMYIQNACAVMKNVFKRSSIYRIGGDEFVIILEDDDFENRSLLVNVIRERVKMTEMLPSVASGKASFAVGCADFDPKTDTHVSEVFKKADINMYENKKTHR